MAGFGNQQPGRKGRLMAELARDKKKTAIMCVLVLVMAIVGVRLVLRMGSSPAAAEAVAGPQAGAMPGLTSDGSPGGAPVGPSHAGRRPANLRDVQARGSITRDLFTPDLDKFPLAQEVKLAPAATATTQTADPEEIRVANVHARAKGLILQSTIVSGTNPKATINGQMLGLKDVIQGFEVVEVTSGACVVEQDGVRVLLEIRQR